MLLTALRVLLIALLTTHVTSLAAQTTSQTLPETQIEVGEAAVSDAEIRNRIIGLMSQIDGFNDVEVAISGGVVTLRGQVLDNSKSDELTSIIERIAGVIAIENRTEISTSLEERLVPAVDRIKQRGRNLVANAPIFLVALGVFGVITTLGWGMTTRTSIWERVAPNAFVGDVYRAVARIFFVLIGLVAALEILNATALLGAVLGAAGVVGLALGFAVRDTVENFIASILLSLRQPFRPNDFVEIDGQQGSVARLTSRATILISPDGNHIRIPNATVFKGRITNFTRDPNRRFVFDLGVDADSDLAAALATAVRAVQDLSFVLKDPPVSAWVAEVGDSNVVLTFTAWVNQNKTDFAKARGEAIRRAKTALESDGFGLPEPIYRLRLDGATATQAAQLREDTAQTEISSPGRDAQTTSALPKASDPVQTADDTADAVARERRAPDTGDDLLSDDKNIE